MDHPILAILSMESLTAKANSYSVEAAPIEDHLSMDTIKDMENGQIRKEYGLKANFIWDLLTDLGVERCLMG